MYGSLIKLHMQCVWLVGLSSVGVKDVTFHVTAGALAMNSCGSDPSTVTFARVVCKQLDIAVYHLLNR